MATGVQAELRLAGSLECQDGYAADTQAATGVVIPCAEGARVSVISDDLKASFREYANTLGRDTLQDGLPILPRLEMDYVPSCLRLEGMRKYWAQEWGSSEWLSPNPDSPNPGYKRTI